MLMVFQESGVYAFVCIIQQYFFVMLFLGRSCMNSIGYNLFVIVYIIFLFVYSHA